jgi:hypothetical protein
MTDYAEAAEDLARENERRQRSMPGKVGNAKRRR